MTLLGMLVDTEFREVIEEVVAAGYLPADLTAESAVRQVELEARQYRAWCELVRANRDGDLTRTQFLVVSPQWLLSGCPVCRSATWVLMPGCTATCQCCGRLYVTADQLVTESQLLVNAELHSLALS